MRFKYIPEVISMKNRIWLLAAFLCLTAASPAPAFHGWEGAEAVSGPEPLTSILAHPLDLEKILVASSRRLFEVSKNSSWKKTGRVYPEQSGIRKVLFFKEVPDSVFVLTSGGIFHENLKNKKSDFIYRGPALSFAVDPQNPRHYFTGTNEGLVESDDSGKTWFPFYRFKRRAVGLLHFSGGHLFAASENTLLVSDDLSFFSPSFFIKETTDEENMLLSEGDGEEIPADSGFHEIISAKNGACLWLATQEGVFESGNSGKSWRALFGAGIREKEILYLAYSETSEALFAATSKSVYRYLPDKKRWNGIFKASGINGMAVIETRAPALLIITDQGISRAPLIPADLDSPLIDIPSLWKTDLFRKLTDMEPSIMEFQKKIIEYNNVKNSKIQRWHAESRISSFLPSLSFGKDFSRGNNIDLDRGGTSDKDLFISGPDDLSRGWDFDVSWDLGDFIWSSNQTSIDSREKLMIELRNDPLAESTRIFYERRRLQMDAVMNPPVSQQEFLDKMLAIDELTSLLDGMSGGFFIKYLERLYRDNPELNRLWEYSGAEEITPSEDVPAGRTPH